MLPVCGANAVPRPRDPQQSMPNVFLDWEYHRYIGSSGDVCHSGNVVNIPRSNPQEKDPRRSDICIYVVILIELFLHECWSIVQLIASTAHIVNERQLRALPDAPLIPGRNGRASTLDRVVIPSHGRL